MICSFLAILAHLSSPVLCRDELTKKSDGSALQKSKTIHFMLKCLCIEIFGAVFIPGSQYLVFPEYFEVSMLNSMHGMIYNFIETITYLDPFFADQRFSTMTSHKGHEEQT